MAQQRGANIYGNVVDTEGNPLPGATVTLTGSLTAPMTVITGSRGLFRFANLPPAKDYCIKVAIQGFKTEIKEQIACNLGSSVNLTITMEMGAIEEEITVVAENPIIDTKKTTIGLEATEEILQEVPTSRDPWAIEKMTAGVYSRYTDVGGSESGSQDAGEAMGGRRHYMTTYTLDGINITDLAARGSSPAYYDFDSFEQINVVTGGSGIDVTKQTAGMGTYMVTKRGGNNLSFGGRFYLTEETFQADNYTDALKEAGVVGVNKINENKDYGFYLGGPFVKDKVWFWISYAVQDIKLWNVYGKRDDMYLANYIGKLNLQLIPQNRFEIFLHTNQRETYGDDPETWLPDGITENYTFHFGIPIVKVQDEHTFGDNLLVSGKFAYVGKGSTRYPMIDPEMQHFAKYNVTDRLWVDGWYGTLMARPQYAWQFIADYFNENLFGVAHEIKIGGEYQRRYSKGESRHPGNVFLNYNYNSPTVDYDGDGNPDIYPGIGYLEVERGSYRVRRSTGIAAYFSDTITFEKFNISLGLRYDYQYPEVVGRDVLAVIKDHPAWKDNFSQDATNAVDRILPAVDMDDVRAYDSEGNDYAWKSLSPRFGITWDIFGDGNTVAKFFTAAYYDWLGSGHAYRWAPGGTSGWMNFWTLDNNSNGIIDLSELYWHRTADYSLYRAFDDAGNFIGDLADAAGLLYGSYDPSNPQTTTRPYYLVDKEVGPERTWEFLGTFEKVILQDFAVTVSAMYRIYGKRSWFLYYYPETGELENQSWYMSAGSPPANIPGIGSTKEASKHEWYVRKQEYEYTPWRFEKPRPDYYWDYYGIDIIFNKRLSNRWMFYGGFTWGHQKLHFGEKGLNNKTNQWALEGQGHKQKYDSPRWMIKASGLYQLPYGIDISFSYQARDGRKIAEFFTLRDYSLGPRYNSADIYMVPFGTERCDVLSLLNLRIQKTLGIGDVGRIVVMADVFNVLNSSILHWRDDKDWGRYTVQGEVFAPNPHFYEGLHALGPLVLRFGVRFTF
jgi:hypothetical protein